MSVVLQQGAMIERYAI